jgi:peptide/nickel transport system permease protein
MAHYVLRRLLLVVPVMLIVSLLSFSLILLVPGDPAVTIAGQSATREQIAAIREALGLDRPLIVQYFSWLGHVLTGDFGTSLSTGQPVVGSILERLPIMLSLAGGALVVAVLLGFPAGVVAAVRRDGVVDRLLGVGAATGLALPSYFVGMLLIILVALNLGWLPPTGYTPLVADPADWLAHIVLPCVALGLVPAAVLARQLRGAMVTALDQDYVRTADAKGLLRTKVVYKHALKNAAIAPLTALGAQFALVVGGSVVVEQVFGIPGLGALAINAVQNRDIPLIQGIVLFTALMVQAINLLVDVSYGWLNPRVRVAVAR